MSVLGVGSVTIVIAGTYAAAETAFVRNAADGGHVSVRPLPTADGPSDHAVLETGLFAAGGSTLSLVGVPVRTAGEVSWTEVLWGAVAVVVLVDPADPGSLARAGEVCAAVGADLPLVALADPAAAGVPTREQLAAVGLPAEAPLVCGDPARRGPVIETLLAALARCAADAGAAVMGDARGPVPSPRRQVRPRGVPGGLRAAALAGVPCRGDG